MKFKGLAVVMACMCCLTMPMQVNAAEDETVVRFTPHILKFYKGNTNIQY